MASILIVDDDAAFRSGLAEMLADLGHAVLEAGSTESGLLQLSRKSVDVAIVDLRMPGEDGLAFMRQASAISPLPCIMLTAYASGDNTIEAMRLGAFDHLTKPVARATLVETLNRLLQQTMLDAGAETFKNTLAPADKYDLIGNSEAMRQVFKRVGRAAASDATVLVLGETGTGKELVARALHRNSTRAAKPFVAINCAAIAADLIESELFGHVKGAFTGAVSARPGRFVEADGGTLFFDEIGDMPLATQAKILRVLQEREVTPLGGNRLIPVDVRIVAATHRNLPQLIKDGGFREDLWYRLQVVPIMMPPLRERLGDILHIAEHFLRLLGGEAPKRITPAAAQQLLAYQWPGNVRELRNQMERAAILSQGSYIDGEHLALSAAPGIDDSPALNWDGKLEEALGTVERTMIRRALAAAGDNRAEAARQLGISRQQLYRKLDEYGVS